MAKRRKTTKRDPAVEAMERARSTRQTQAARVKPPGKIRRPARGPSHGRGSTPLADLRNRLNLSDTASAYDVAASALAMIDDLEHQLANPPQTSPLDLGSTASLKDF